MNRLILAAEAQQLSRQIWASLSLGSRQAFTIQHIFKVAYGDDYTSLGISILKAMDDAGIDGEIASTGKTVSELQDFIRKNQIGKLKKYADVLGRAALDGRKGIPGLNGQAREDAVTRAVIMLASRGFSPGNNFAQAMAYVQTTLRNAAKDVIKSKKIHERKHEKMTPSDVHQFMGEIGSIKRDVPKKMWDDAIAEVRNDPDLKTPDGREVGYAYIMGILSGLSDSEIAAQLEMGAPNLARWKKRHMSTLAEIFQETFDYTHTAA